MLFFILAPIVSTFSPLLSIIPLYISVQSIFDGVTGNYIKDSCFMVYKNKKIKVNDKKVKVNMLMQKNIDLVKMFKLIFKKDKRASFINEAYKMFEQLPQIKNNEIIKYGCQSHSITYNLLKSLEKNGYIQNLEKELVGKKTLLIEEIAMGIKPTFKKRKVYNMCFELTNKKINKEAFLELSNKREENYEKNNGIESSSLDSIKKQENLKISQLQQQIKSLDNSINAMILQFQPYMTIPQVNNEITKILEKNKEIDSLQIVDSITDYKRVVEMKQSLLYFLENEIKVINNEKDQNTQEIQVENLEIDQQENNVGGMHR